MPRATSTVAASRVVGSGGGRVNPEVGTKSCAGKQNQGNCYESRQRYECPTQCCLTPRSRRGPTSKRQARAVGWRNFHHAGLAFCCRSRLSSNVRPRMPTLTGSPPFFKTQQRAQRGTSAFAAFCEHIRLWPTVQKPNFSPPCATSSNAGRGASAPGCGQHGECEAVQWRACRAPVRNFSSGRAVASPARTVQGLILSSIQVETNNPRPSRKAA